jgi:hypothetical protein
MDCLALLIVTEREEEMLIARIVADPPIIAIKPT